MGVEKNDAKKALIFVVDDSCAYRNLMSLLLIKEGYDVKSFEDALNAIESLETYTPDLIVSDLEMPFMNGLDFFRELKRLNNSHLRIPFIIVSSTEDESAIEEIKRETERPFYRKSIPIHKLIKRINRIVSNPELMIMSDHLKNLDDLC